MTADLLTHVRFGGGGAASNILQSGGGGGTSGGMETRVAVLEAHMEHVRTGLDRLSGLPADVAGIKASMATKADLHDMQTAISASMRNWIAIGVAAASAIFAGLKFLV